MAIREDTCYICTNGRYFRDERQAREYQDNLVLTALDKAMRGLGEGRPDLHYPNLSLALLPYMQKHAKEIIAALGLEL